MVTLRVELFANSCRENSREQMQLDTLQTLMNGLAPTFRRNGDIKKPIQDSSRCNLCLQSGVCRPLTVIFTTVWRVVHASKGTVLHIDNFDISGQFGQGRVQRRGLRCA